MQTIKINVVDKVATAEGNPFIVCGNDDYTILFNFDKAWDGYNAKTARFTYERDGEEIIAEVPFAGNSCAAPAIYNTKKVDIGVYAGDILSTTRCRINCKASILDGEGIEHEEPPADVYNEMVAICNEAVTAAGEAKEAAAGFEATTRETFANAIKGNLYGAAVRADDVSPVEHNLACKVESKNLIPYPYSEKSATRNGITFTIDENDKGVIVDGTATVNTSFNWLSSTSNKLKIEKGQTYTFSCNLRLTSATGYIFLQNSSNGVITDRLFIQQEIVKFTATETGYASIGVVVLAGATLNNEKILVQLERGSAATEYTPYIDPSTATVTKCSKNLIPYPYQDKTKTYNGISYKDNGDGSVTASGFSTQQSNFAFTAENFNIKKGVNYTLSLKGSFQIDNYLTLYIHSSEENRTIASLITTASKSITFKADKDCTTAAIYIVVPTGRTISGTFAPQLEIGTIETDYEPYSVPTTYAPDADGTVEGITSLSPTMTLLTDTAGTVINCTYSRDSNKAITDLKTPEGTVVSQNADFAEVAEWADGNPDNEDRTGYFVCANVPVDGIVMKKATSTDDVKGVSIQAPAFAGNYSADKLDSNGKLLPKYSYVAIIGFVPVIDNGTCEIGGRCMPDDNGCAIPSSNSMGYQVINRIDENRVLIIIEPNGDMVQRIKTKINQLQTDKEDKINKIADLTANVEGLNHDQYPSALATFNFINDIGRGLKETLNSKVDKEEGKTLYRGMELIGEYTFTGEETNKIVYFATDLNGNSFNLDELAVYIDMGSGVTINNSNVYSCYVNNYTLNECMFYKSGSSGGVTGRYFQVYAKRCDKGYWNNMNYLNLASEHYNGEVRFSYAMRDVDYVYRLRVTMPLIQAGAKVSIYGRRVE